MDPIVFQLAVLFVPGLIWAQLDAMYGMRKEPSRVDFLVAVIVYGMLTHITIYLLYWTFGFDYAVEAVAPPETAFLRDEIADQIAASIPVSIVLAVLWLAGRRYKLIARGLTRIGVTNRHGAEDVWAYTLNADDPRVQYVHFHDFERGVLYAGWVASFSATDRLRELLLRRVRVHDLQTRKFRYYAPYLYVCRPKEHAVMEFPAGATCEPAGDSVEQVPPLAVGFKNKGGNNPDHPGLTTRPGQPDKMMNADPSKKCD